MGSRWTVGDVAGRAVADGQRAGDPEDHGAKEGQGEAAQTTDDGRGVAEDDQLDERGDVWTRGQQDARRPGEHDADHPGVADMRPAEAPDSGASWGSSTTARMATPVRVRLKRTRNTTATAGPAPP